MSNPHQSLMLQPPSDSDSECSESNSSNSSDTTSSSGNSGQDINELFETAQILSARLNLPKDLCESPAIFKEFFSLDTWHCLPEEVQNHLKTNFLPNFEENDEVEKDITIERLFSGKLDRFGQRPLKTFQYNLEEGNYRPDIARLRAVVERSKRHEQRFQECERISRMAKMMVISREKLLKAVNEAQPGSSFRPERIMAATPKLSSSGAAQRAKKRYFQEISQVVEEVGLPRTLSDDENYPEGPPPQLSRKQKRHLTGIQMGAVSPGAERRIFCTLNSKDGNLDHLVGPGGSAPLSEESYRQMLHRHKKRKLEEFDHPELDTSEVQLKEIFERTKLAANVGRKPLSYGKSQNLDAKKPAPAFTSPSVVTQKPTAGISRFQEQLNRSQSLLMLGQTASTSTASVTQKQTTEQPELLTVATKSNLNFTSDTDDEDFDDLLDDDASMQQQLEQQYAHKYGFEEDEDYEDELSGYSQHSLLGTTNKLPMKNNIGSGKKINPLINNKKANVSSVKFGGLPNVKQQAKHGIDENVTIAHDPTGMFEDRALAVNNNRVAKQQLPTNNSGFNVSYGSGKVKAATLSDLEGIDMMHLPVDLDDGGNINILDELRTTPTISNHQDSKLMGGDLLAQDKHVCFLSLIRDCFCATPDHRMPLDELRRKVSMEMSNPITALNNWYNHTENWLALLISAINFLAGEFIDQPEDFVPYIEFKSQLNTYQWIGAGRDSDNHLLPLYQFWLTRRNEMGVRPSSSGSSTTPSKQKNENKHYNKQYHHNNVYNSNSSLTDEDYGQPERMVSPPPPRSTTSWIVRKATNEDIREFRRQEKRRYENPHMAYTYRQHGYESVVGPVKGIYTQVPGISKARDHNMLVPERPNYVTILTLVRDATARLPNGEGTRVEICELLKSSQYISQTAHDQLQTIVSGALDRMHTEHDPCVKYDAKKKIWIYLHRNRSEEEFERLHHQYQGVAKPKTPKARIKGPYKQSQSPPPHHSMQQSPLMPGKLLQSPQKPNSIKLMGHNTSGGSPGKLNSSSNSSSPSTPSPTPQYQHQLPTITAKSLSPVVGKVVGQLPQKTLFNAKLVKSSNAMTPPLSSANEQSMEYMLDVEASLDIHTTPILVKSTMPSKQLGESVTINRTGSPAGMLNKTTLVSSPGLANRVKKLTTNIHAQQPVKQPSMTSILVSHQNQRAQSPNVAKVGGSLLTTQPGSAIKKNISRSLIINSSTTPHHLPATTAVTTTKIIPSVANQIKLQHQPMLQKQPINAKNSLLQNKQIIRVNSTTMAVGKNLVNPASVVNTSSTSTGSATVQIKSSPTPGSRTNIISTITLPKGQQAFTSAQQKQILQTIMASQQQQKQQQLPKGGLQTTTQPTTSGNPRVIFTQQMNNQQVTSTATTATSGHQHFIQKVTTSGSSTGSTATTATTNPQQVLQVQQQSGGSSKVHMMTATNLTPQQQQQLLQTIKQQQQVKNQTGSVQQSQQQQSLIVNKPFIQFQRTNPTTATKTSPQIIGQMTNKQLPMSTIHSSVNNQTVTANVASTLTRVIKPGTSIVQQQNLSNQIAAGSSGGTTIKTGTTTMTKMLTNSSGQVMSLETLLQQKGIAPGTTLRVAGSKPGQTQLIQIAGGTNTGTPGQYTVVSQGRNIISMSPQQRMITTQAGSIVKTAEIKSSSMGTVTTSSIVNSNVVIANNNQSAGLEQTTTAQPQQQFKIIHAPNQQHTIQQHQLQQISATDMLNTTKLVGMQNVIGGKTVKTTGIRMVNASNLNIAHIGGKPVIIASKNSVGGMTQIAGNQNIVLQSSGGAGTSTGTNFMIGGQTVKLQGNLLSTANLNLINQQQSQQQQPQTVMLGNQLVKVQAINQIQQQAQQSIRQQNRQIGESIGSQGTVLLGNTGQTIKVHPQVSMSNSGQQVLIGNQIKNPVKTNATIQQQPQQQQQRVMLATQGQGGQLVTQQILLPPGFQGGSINIQTLKGLKVIPINQQGKASGPNSDRPVYARILSTAPQQTKTVNQVNPPNTSQNTGNE